jgi:mono/diheme cytochrome c family protein
MKAPQPSRPFLFAWIFWLLAAGIFTAASQPSNVAVTSTPLHVSDFLHSGEPLPPNILAWDAVKKSADATNGQEFAYFSFTFTNISPETIAILSGHGSCSCTTVQLPPLPWIIPAGGVGKVGVTITLDDKTGTLFKYATVSTKKGAQRLDLQVNILPPPKLSMSEADRARGVAAAKTDRQAVFKGDCVNCHASNIQGRYGPQLFDRICAVCHEASPHATMVPDLHNLKEPTSEEFWRAWITSGKPGTLMPAFAASQGGPLNDLQISSLAAYLNTAIPSHVPPAATNNPNLR